MSDPSPFTPEQEAELQAAAAKLRAASPEFDAADNLRRLQVRIQAERDWQQAIAAGRSRRSRPGWLAGWGFAAGAAAALAVVAVMPRLGWQLGGQAGLETLSATRGTPTSPKRLTVAFRPEVRIEAIDALLRPLGAQIVAGPSALGLWQIAVPPAELAPIKSQLLASGLVEQIVEEP